MRVEFSLATRVGNMRRHKALDRVLYVRTGESETDVWNRAVKLAKKPVEVAISGFANSFYDHDYLAVLLDDAEDPTGRIELFPIAPGQKPTENFIEAVKNARILSAAVVRASEWVHDLLPGSWRPDSKTLAGIKRRLVASARPYRYFDVTLRMKYPSRTRKVHYFVSVAGDSNWRERAIELLRSKISEDGQPVTDGWLEPILKAVESGQKKGCIELSLAAIHRLRDLIRRPWWWYAETGVAKLSDADSVSVHSTLLPGLYLNVTARRGENIVVEIVERTDLGRRLIARELVAEPTSRRVLDFDSVVERITDVVNLNMMRWL